MAFAARAEDSELKWALSLGAGAAHGVFGPQLELRRDHFSGFAGVGVVDVPWNDYYGGPEGNVSVALGARWLSGNGEGVYLSLHAAVFAAKTAVVYGDFENRTRIAVGLTGGWRLKVSDSTFLDVGIGPAVQFLHVRGRAEIGSGPGHREFDEYRFGAGFIWGFGSPDFDLAIGYQF